jgi:hypothetical protein
MKLCSIDNTFTSMDLSNQLPVANGAGFASADYTFAPHLFSFRSGKVVSDGMVYLNATLASSPALALRVDVFAYYDGVLRLGANGSAKVDIEMLGS